MLTLNAFFDLNSQISSNANGPLLFDNFLKYALEEQRKSSIKESSNDKQI